jgi:hypothetical protein
MTGFDSKQRMAANKLQEPVQEPVASVHIKDGCLVGSHRNGSKLFPDGQYGLWPIATPPLPVQPAQPAQEPVAWAVQGCSKMWRGEFAEIDAKAEAKRIGGTCVAYALHAAPSQRPWVGLTAEDFNAIKFPVEMRFPAEFRAGARWADTKLKEKNA